MKRLVCIAIIFVLLLSSFAVAGFFDDGLVDSFTGVDSFSGYAVLGSVEPGVSTISLFSGFVMWVKSKYSPVVTTPKKVSTPVKKATRAVAAFNGTVVINCNVENSMVYSNITDGYSHFQFIGYTAIPPKTSLNITFTQQNVEINVTKLGYMDYVKVVRVTNHGVVVVNADLVKVGQSVTKRANPTSPVSSARRRVR